MKKTILFFTVLAAGFIAAAQQPKAGDKNPVNPGFGNNSMQQICGQLSFSSDEEVLNLVNQILEYAGVVNRSYEIRGCANVSGCFATVIDEQQYIVYQPDYLQNVKKYGFTSASLPTDNKDWQALTILAHEVGHLINGHFYRSREDLTPWGKELQADEFAGKIIYHMKGTLEQAQAVYNTSLVPADGTMSHPPRKDRLEAVAKGYNNTKRIFSGNTQTTTTNTNKPVTDAPVITNSAHGYRVKVKFTDVKPAKVYLAHYYGKPLPTIYTSDSAIVGANGIATFENTDKINGGIYIILLDDKKTYFEFLLDDGDDLFVTANTAQLPTGLIFSGSPMNKDFVEYVTFLADYGKRQKNGTAKADELTNYRQNYIDNHPVGLLSAIFRALKTPEIPKGKHYLPDGKEDENFAYYYYKKHYWDDFDFNDERLINTPLYDSKLDEYFNKIVVSIPDSIEKEADILLAKTRRSKELFKYTLWWITRFAENSKTMGMDEVFVYLVENYYAKGDAIWLSKSDLEKYTERAAKISPNLIGRTAPGMILTGTDGTTYSLNGIDAKYTLIIFWNPDCNRCADEIAEIRTLYNRELRRKGMKVFTVNTGTDTKKWNRELENLGIEEWTNVYDASGNSKFKDLYDVYSTPMIYLLDEKKIIRGKKLDHSNIPAVIKTLD